MAAQNIGRRRGKGSRGEARDNPVGGREERKATGGAGGFERSLRVETDVVRKVSVAGGRRS